MAPLGHCGSSNAAAASISTASESENGQQGLSIGGEQFRRGSGLRPARAAPTMHSTAAAGNTAWINRTAPNPAVTATPRGDARTADYPEH
jgi:hypothetical protein